jgi:hypothetical protein
MSRSLSCLRAEHQPLALLPADDVADSGVIGLAPPIGVGSWIWVASGSRLPAVVQGMESGIDRRICDAVRLPIFDLDRLSIVVVACPRNDQRRHVRAGAREHRRSECPRAPIRSPDRWRRRRHARRSTIELINSMSSAKMLPLISRRSAGYATSCRSGIGIDLRTVFVAPPNNGRTATRTNRQPRLRRTADRA